MAHLAYRKSSHYSNFFLYELDESPRDIKTIAKHINNALKEELKEEAVVAKYATTE